MKKETSPGTDGMPPKLLPAYGGLLGPVVFKAINSTVVKRIPSEPKLSQICYNLCLLPQLNIHIKLCAKVVVEHRKDVIHKSVHPDPDRFYKDKISIRYHLTSFTCYVTWGSKDHMSSTAVLSLYAKKAFDCLQCGYLWIVLKHLELGAAFII